MKIRRGTDKDVPRLLEIWRSAVDATHQFVSAEDRTEIDAIVAGQYLPEAELWVVVDSDDRPMAFMGLAENSIDSLFVDPQVHGQGYGTALVEHALTIVPNPTVEANEQASNAVAFYVSRGFRIVGRSETDGDGRPYPLVHLAR